MSVTIGLTEIMPLSLLLPNGATNRFVQARLYNDATGTEIAGSPATLTHLSSGRYTNYSKAAPARFGAYSKAGFDPATMKSKFEEAKGQIMK